MSDKISVREYEFGCGSRRVLVVVCLDVSPSVGWPSGPTTHTEGILERHGQQGGEISGTRQSAQMVVMMDGQWVALVLTAQQHNTRRSFDW